MSNPETQAEQLEEDNQPSRADQIKRRTFLALCATSVGICSSHAVQMFSINFKCDSLRKRTGRSIERAIVHATIIETIKELNQIGRKTWKDKGGLRFITGDFEIENGKSRCGGIAHAFAARLARHGYETRVSFENFHYYGQVYLDGRWCSLKGNPPHLSLHPPYFEGY